MGIFNLFSKKEDEKAYYNKVDYSILNEAALRTDTKVSVVVPVYNAIAYLEKTVDSIIKQTIGFENITCILVDDGSNDGSRELLKSYSETYENIVSIFLGTNTGTPAFPRNLGTHLANSKYIMYVDADDWLSLDGIQILYDLLEETNGKYAVGKSIQVDSKGQKVIGRYESSKVRHNVSPFSIKHLFYHLGPRARMMSLDLIKHHKIRYPEMKFAEDKQFFIDVILAAGEISTTTETIYYLNRIDDNNSLTKQTDIGEKMDSNIKVLKYVLNKKLEPEKEKNIVNRLIEFDCITRLFDRKHFIKSKDKQMYYDKFHEAMGIFKKAKRPYEIRETIIKPINVIYFDLAMAKDYGTLEALAKWSKKGGETKQIIENGHPYNVAVLENGKELKIPVRLKAELDTEMQDQEKIQLKIKLTGHSLPPIEGVALIDRANVENVYQLPNAVKQKEDSVVVSLKMEELTVLPKGSYEFALMYEDYEKKLVKKRTETTLTAKLDNGKKFNLYKTINNNIGVKVK